MGAGIFLSGDRIGHGRHKTELIERDAVACMPSMKSEVRWSEAVLLTVSLWLFVMLIFMPRLIQRHGSDLTSIALDCSTFLVSIALAMPLFAIFRATLNSPLPRRIAALLGGVLAASIIQTSFDLIFTGWLAENVDAVWNTLGRDLARGYESAFRYLLVFLVNVALFQLTFSRRREFVQDRKLSDAISAAQQAQLTALRYQLNPHFLFNSLNSISALIVTKRNADAEQMTAKLSSFLRNSLTADPARLVPLEEELSLIEEYLDIESVRFGDRLEVEIECDPQAGEALVPSFIVQPLVENAIKHGVAPSKEPVHIHIRAVIEGNKLCIDVENGIAREVTQTRFGGTGTGLKNIERRLGAVYGARASLSAEQRENTYLARICIPEIQRAS
jgi:hypothetical protein